MDGPLTNPVRQAIAAGEFEKAQVLWEGYAAQLRRELAEGAVSAARLEEMRELVEWSRRTVLCATSHDRSRMDALAGAVRVAQAYEGERSHAAALIQTNL
jgi:hypothetical protein